MPAPAVECARNACLRFDYVGTLYTLLDGSNLERERARK